MPDNQYPFFMELLNRFDFVSYKSDPEIAIEEDSNENVMQQVKADIKELQLVLRGKHKARPARKLLNEL